MMKIEILGTGCPKCKLLMGNVEKATRELDVKADIKHITDMDKILEYGIMTTPALVIDGDVKCAGRIPDMDEIKGWLK